MEGGGDEDIGLTLLLVHVVLEKGGGPYVDDMLLEVAIRALFRAGDLALQFSRRLIMRQKQDSR